MNNQTGQMRQNFIDFLDEEVSNYLEQNQQTMVMLPVIGACIMGYMETYSIIGFCLPTADMKRLGREGKLPE